MPLVFAKGTLYMILVFLEPFLQSNLFNTDTKGTEASARFTKVFVL